jgi:hypothetical protein
MGSIYSGFLSNNGYLFITNDIFGITEDEGAIVKVNNLCGALIVTTRRDLLIRMRNLLDRCLFNLTDMGEGLSINLARIIVDSFKREFQKEPNFKENPLPFLMLLVGYTPKQPSCPEHIFIRNRVIEIIEKNVTKEYVTDFEIQTPVPAKNLFYGHSELIQFLFQQLPAEGLDLEMMKLFAYFSITETHKIDGAIFPDVRMASISKDNGFEWIKAEEMDRLSSMAKSVEIKLSKGLTMLS